MDLRRSNRSQSQSSQRMVISRRLVKLFIVLCFMTATFIFISLLWKPPVLAPEVEQPTSHSDLTENPKIIEQPTPEPEPELTAEELEAIEQERLRQERLAFEAGYYNQEPTAVEALNSKWLLMPSTIALGDVLLVRHDEPAEIEWENKTYTLQPFGEGYYTYLPMSISLPPGEYTIGDQTLTVLAKNFETQYLEVTTQMESMRRDTDRINADQLKINRARAMSAPEFLFAPDSVFVKPMEGRMTTPFGYTRYVNGSFSGSHRAIDWAAPEGTPIQTTNEGIVALADELYLTGNAIYIDHGMGLFSQYAHMSELLVETGDHVKPGDIIGLVGTTGFSTGPHLHFTFWAHNVPVNPDLFFGKTPFQWLEAAFQAEVVLADDEEI